MSLNLEQMDQSDKSKTSMPVNLGAHLLSSTNQQSAQVDLLPMLYSPIPVNIVSHQLPSSEGHFSQGRFQTSMTANHGSYQLAFLNKHPTQMGLLPNVQAPSYMGFQQLPSTSRLPLVKESLVQNPLSVNVGSQHSASKKRPAQREAPPKFHNSMSISQGSQQTSSTNKRSSQTEPLPKAQTESFESVRSKLRESLAAAFVIVPNRQTKPQVVEKNSPKEAVNLTGQAEVGTEPGELCSTALNPSLNKNSLETSTTNEHVMKCGESQGIPSDAGPCENMSDNTEVGKCDVQEDRTKHVSLENEVPFSKDPIIADELLQGHGLCWASDADAENSETIMNQEVKTPKFLHEEVTEIPKSLDEEANGDSKKSALQNAESLAIKIEAELFKLFGGVNKKYKERGRSLLFNLKDRNNPELRERVLSGDIAPERLCSMTADDLASKELSEWRLAKAEELAQMVVLPDTEVDIRRLVKKTHKGEFQVEVEQDDSVSVEVAVGESLLSRIPAKVTVVQTRPKSNENRALSKPHETKGSEGLLLSEKADSGDQNDSSNFDNLLNEKTDYMQDLMVDELKDSELLPPIVSLDEFMEALDSEPPFENLSVATNLPEKNSDGLEPEMDPESDILEPKSDPALDNVVSNLDSSQEIIGLNLSPVNTGSKDPEKIAPDNTGSTVNIGKVNVYARPDSDLKSSSAYTEPETSLPDIKFKSENIWEGLIQLNISALAAVIGFFRSGEKTSTQQWPTFLEIKGRVRLDAFDKFLQELPLSRSRAIMIAEFRFKEGSHESGRLHLCETINSYIADQRVGFAEPVSGVELYFCPPHPKTIEMLGRHLPKDHIETLHSTVNGLIGVIVWRRPHVTAISPRMPSQHKHGTSTKRQSSSRKQQNVINSNSSRSSIHQPSGSPAINPQTLLDDELIEDVPPGFGPGNIRDEDDLPEFDFVHTNSQSKGVVGMTNLHAPTPPPPARPAEQMRELIQKYGQGDNAKRPRIQIQPWNDGDDIPEWLPHQNNQPQLQQLAPPLLPPPPPQLPPMPMQPNNYQQQTMQQPFLVNQHPVQFQPHQQMQQMQQLMPLAAPLPMPLQAPLQPQMALMQGQHNVNPGWQQAQWWPPAGGPADMGVSLPINAILQPCHLSGQPSDGQFYGVPAFGAVQMGWRPDDPRSRDV